LVMVRYRTTGFYVQDLTITNTSGNPVAGPLYLVVRNLTTGVTLVSKSGLTSTVTPTGTPYVVMQLPGDGLTLPGGASITLGLRFLNSSRLFINFAPDVVTTSNEP